ncbi:alpha/beta fold hydrolase [Roseateles toxinivorans]|uniref:Pimeloyl-ACP methyl ester carboxylesterase n=1 Tax=Roseateles toxinivorans TaxID=270368 RepID=A0A4R6QKM9_9BURK|nr:alpha/beta hydrolase [Roseateles toxinivorans]TDP63933.1 pimeloyl-ACP methyl ester carboxylesterase [Roseateles toxinivorans]
MNTWLLLRGLTREARHWGDFPALLAKALPGSQVLTLDLPGNGQWHRERSPSTVEAMADFCEARRAGLKTPVNVIAMSLGAMVAVAWAQRHAGAVQSAVLINTSLRPFSPVHHRLRPANYPALLRLALGATPLQWEQTVLRLTSRHAGTPQAERLAQWLSYRRDCPVSRANALRQLWAASRYRAPLEKPALPLLLLNSGQDSLVDSRCSAALALAWQCPLRQHPSAGHDLPLDDGGWVVDQIIDWLSSQP